MTDSKPASGTALAALIADYEQAVFHLPNSMGFRQMAPDLVAAAKSEQERLVEAVNKSICCYCGELGPREVDYMIAHMEKCEKHPYHKFREDLKKAQAEMEPVMAHNKIMWEALEKLAKLGNGDEYGNSEGNVIAQEALSALSGAAKNS